MEKANNMDAANPAASITSGSLVRISRNASWVGLTRTRHAAPVRINSDSCATLLSVSIKPGLFLNSVLFPLAPRGRKKVTQPPVEVHDPRLAGVTMGNQPAQIK